MNEGERGKRGKKENFHFRDFFGELNNYRSWKVNFEMRKKGK